MKINKDYAYIITTEKIVKFEIQFAGFTELHDCVRVVGIPTTGNQFYGNCNVVNH